MTLKALRGKCTPATSDDHPHFRPRLVTGIPLTTETGRTRHQRVSNQLPPRQDPRGITMFASEQEASQQDFCLISATSWKGTSQTSLQREMWLSGNIGDFKTHEKGLILVFATQKLIHKLHWPLVSTLSCWPRAGW